jgi:hypothetical protein
MIPNTKQELKPIVQPEADEHEDCYCAECEEQAYQDSEDERFEVMCAQGLL